MRGRGLKLTGDFDMIKEGVSPLMRGRGLKHKFLLDMGRISIGRPSCGGVD